MGIIRITAEGFVGEPMLKKNEKCEKCSIITQEELEALFSKDIAQIETIISIYNEYAPKFHVDTCLRKAHFWAQIREESGSRLAVKSGESLIYSAARLYHRSNFKDTKGRTIKKGPFAKFWGQAELCLRYGDTTDDDKIIGIPYESKKRPPKHKANQVEIANIAYAGRLGNGDAVSGDGWRFRGGGFIQVTGRNQYDTINQTIKKCCHDFTGTITFENINNIKESMISALAYWKCNNLNAKADKGYEKNIVDSITRVINYNTDSYSERFLHFQKAISCFKTKECSYDKEATTNK